MRPEKFSFGSTSVMREVPPGQSAVIKFNGKADKVETEPEEEIQAEPEEVETEPLIEPEEETTEVQA